MEKFYQYTVEELVLNEEFRQMVLDPEPGQELAFSQWIEAHPAETQQLLTAADIIRSVRVEHAPLPASEHAEAVEQIFARTSRRKQTRPLRPLYYWAIGAAATLAVIIGFYIIPSRENATELASNQGQQDQAAGWKRNNGPRSELIQLADGSSIFLKPGSAVRYPARFAADSRKVELQGEAFFEVAPDQSRPFYVYANKTVTKVLGTSFHVSTSGNQNNTVVGVWSGKVSVSSLSSAGPPQSAQVTPGEQVTVSGNGQAMTKSALQSNHQISQFLRTAANGKDIEVVHYLNTARKAFDLDITFDPKKLKGCKIRANFEGIHLLDQISAMCKAIGASYSIQNGGIVIKSSGCQS